MTIVAVSNAPVANNQSGSINQKFLATTQCLPDVAQKEMLIASAAVGKTKEDQCNDDDNKLINQSKQLIEAIEISLRIDPANSIRRLQEFKNAISNLKNKIFNHFDDGNCPDENPILRIYSITLYDLLHSNKMNPNKLNAIILKLNFDLAKIKASPRFTPAQKQQQAQKAEYDRKNRFTGMDGNSYIMKYDLKNKFDTLPRLQLPDPIQLLEGAAAFGGAILWGSGGGFQRN